MPDFCERSVFESLVNALIHRDYLVNGSEVHIDIFDDRLVIYSPGGMPDGTNIQERDKYNSFYEKKSGLGRHFWAAGIYGTPGKRIK